MMEVDIREAILTSHSLFGGPLDFYMNFSSKVVHAITEQVEAELILVRVDPDELGASEGGHIDGPCRVQPPGVDHQLELGQAQGRELALGAERVVVRSLK